MKNFLTCSTCAYFALALVELGLDQRAHLRARWASDGDVLGSPCSLGPGHDLLLVERDQHDRVRPAVAVHHGLRDPARTA